MSSNLIRWNRSTLSAFLTLVALVGALAGDARAACFTSGARSPLTGAKTQFADAAAAAASSLNDDDDDRNSSANIVGLWNARFLIGTGPDAYDQGYQQFHSDGNENMLSRGLPPALGNVCVGVWKQMGPRAYKLKHVAWNWNLDGTFAGTFVLEVALRVDRHGRSYTGTWVADSFDVAGAVIPELRFEGVVRATRITVD